MDVRKERSFFSLVFVVEELCNRNVSWYESAIAIHGSLSLRVKLFSVNIIFPNVIVWETDTDVLGTSTKAVPTAFSILDYTQRLLS